MIGFQPFSHTDYMIVGKTKFLVEGCCLIVSRTNLQIDFGTTHFPQSGFHRIHDFLSVTPFHENPDGQPNNLSTRGGPHNLPLQWQLNYYPKFQPKIVQAEPEAFWQCLYEDYSMKLLIRTFSIVQLKHPHLLFEMGGLRENFRSLVVADKGCVTGG